MAKESNDYTEQYKKFYEAWGKTMTEVVDFWKQNPLAGKTQSGESVDLKKFYKDFYDRWENSASDTLENWVNSPLFANNIGKLIEKSSEFKKHFDDIVEKTLKSMRFPSKSDVDNILAAINNLEAKVNDLDDKIESLITKQRKTSKK